MIQIDACDVTITPEQLQQMPIDSQLMYKKLGQNPRVMVYYTAKRISHKHWEVRDEHGNIDYIQTSEMEKIVKRRKVTLSHKERQNPNTSELTAPSYYQHPILGETSAYVRHMTYFQGAMFKYVLRAGNKPGVPASHDIAKARECARLSRDKNGRKIHMTLSESLSIRLEDYAEELHGSDTAEEWRVKALIKIGSTNYDDDFYYALDYLEELLEQKESESA